MTDNFKEEEQKECFGCLDKVFPKMENGLRQTPDDCYYFCPVKTKCLKKAMATKDGVQVEEEIIKRETKSGAMSFLERWSRRKQMHKKLNKPK